MQGSVNARLWASLATCALLSTLAARPCFPQSPAYYHTLFCVRDQARWVVQAYAPLVDTRRGTVIEQAIYSGRTVTHIVIKNYNTKYELLYDYHFAEDGRLIAMRAYMQLWGRWLAEADLKSNPDGSIARPDVHYRLHADGGIVEDPEDGPEYVEAFRSAPVYATEAQVPCAVLFQQAERLNATQE